MDDNLYDVIVAGAGPGGATTAYNLAQRGFKVLVLEKEHLPRYKTCGGGITVKTAKLLDFDISPVIEQTVTGVVVSSRLKRKVTWRTDGPVCYMVMRTRFDALLVKQAREAGATVLEGCAVKSAAVDDDGVTVTTRDGTSFRGKVVVGADGANGVVARSLGLMRNVPVDIGLESEVNVAAPDMDFWRDYVLLDIGTLKRGYGWIFPKGDHLSIGVGGSADDPAAVKKYAAEFGQWCRSMLGAYEVTHDQGHRMPMRPVTWAFRAQRGLLVGDAAGMINPLDGEGIYYAVRSGQLAATCIADALAGKASLDFAAYERAIHEQLTVEQHTAGELMRIFNYAPWFFVWVLEHSRRMRVALTKLLRGELRYSEIPTKLGPLGRIVPPLAQ